MIDYNPKNWFTLIFQIHRSEMMRYLLPNIFLMGLYSAGLCYVFENHWQFMMPKEAGFHALLGVVLGLVLVFRTNTAYDRWWEGRKLWGNIVNHSRGVALKLSTILPHDDKATRAFFAKSIANFSFALKEHLRGNVKWEDLDLSGLIYEQSIKTCDHVPNHLIQAIHQKLADLYKTQRISGDNYRTVLRDLEGLVDAMGACERIKKTPIPFSYSMYVKKVIFAYLVSLPLSFIHLFSYWTIPAVMFTTYVLAGIEIIAEEIEDPFGTDSNDLDTDGISRTIRNNAMEILGLRP